ncbi:hypothetical protein RJT34_12719 [Clitoria ternatea]|uniref:Uncharacterized protein n=1 Tax=Clitoria ternatea TaxID=43366 RepID=A0AAN9JPW6_CLITE
MLFSMQLLGLYKQPQAVFTQLVQGDEGILKHTYPCSCSIVRAVKGDSQSEKYEVDQDKAKEALKKLDDQIQSLSNKQPPSPKLRVSEVKVPEVEGRGRGNDKVEITDSFLTNVAVGLLLFTIFYNVLFYSVIKPSIDGYP